MTKNTIGIIIVIAILFVGGFYFVNGGFQLSTTADQGQFIGVPTFGYLSCEQSQSLVRSPADDFVKFGTKYITCNSVGSLLQECDVIFKLPSKDEVKGKDSFLGLKYCQEGYNCLEDSTFDEQYFARKAYGVSGTDYGRIINVHLTKGQVLLAQYMEGDFFNAVTGADVVRKGRYALTYKPYKIYKYDMFSQANGASLYDSEDCKIPGTSVEALNYIVEDVAGGGKISENSQVTDLLNQNNLQQPGARMAFVSNFVAIVPPQYDYIDGTDTYCYDKNIYKIEEVTLRQGTYKIADTSTNKQIKSVECCNDGDALPGYYCDNFTKVPLGNSDGASCNILKPCPLVGFVAIPGKQVAYQECVSNKCETSSMSVNCNFDSDCGNGYCDVDALHPENNKCVTRDPIDKCGNGFCEASFGETIQSCSADCSPVAPKNSNGLLFFLIGAIVIMIFAIVFFVAKGKLNGGNDILA